MHPSFEKLPQDRKDHIVQSGIDEFSKKSYQDASTDEITKQAGISKGLLFHYFGSKKNFYLYCLDQALERLMAPTLEPGHTSFLDILLSNLDEKFKHCLQYPAETRFVNLAARETSSQVQEGKQQVFARHAGPRKAQSAQVMARAVSTLRLKGQDPGLVTKALLLYTEAIINQYLVAYQERPEAFFQNREQIRQEFKAYLAFMLKGIEREE